MSTFALSLPFVRFEGSKSYSPLLFFLRYEFKYTLAAIRAIKIIIVITKKIIYVSLGTDSVKIRIRNTITIAMVE
ncbi:MAG: hypothetical protein IPM14_17505 [bacterium]|nr:hypothetical protein [bacterium]